MLTKDELRKTESLSKEKGLVQIIALFIKNA